MVSVFLTFSLLPLCMMRPETRVAGRVEGMRGTKATAGAARRAKRARTRMLFLEEGVGLLVVYCGG